MLGHHADRQASQQAEQHTRFPRDPTRAARVQRYVKTKKLIPERTCDSFRVVEASNDQKPSIGELPSARVFIAIRTTATSQLTNQQRADISGAAKFNFSADDWRIIDQAREFFYDHSTRGAGRRQRQRIGKETKTNRCGGSIFVRRRNCEGKGR
jgi:hypothetical protein